MIEISVENRLKDSALGAVDAETLLLEYARASVGRSSTKNGNLVSGDEIGVSNVVFVLSVRSFEMYGANGFAHGLSVDVEDWDCDIRSNCGGLNDTDFEGDV